MKVQAASAVVPAASHKRALELISEGLSDPVLGQIHMDKVQICPQHAGYINDELVDELISLYPETNFRLHASPKIKGCEKGIYHVSNSREGRDYFAAADRINKKFKAEAYSIHSGEREHCTIEEMVERLREIQDNSSVPIAVEGLYPTKTNRWLMSDWREYEYVAEQGCLYALDLSHLNIVARYHGPNHSLVRNLLSSQQCVEVHVSANDGRADSHKPLEETLRPWWLDILMESGSESTIFYEGVLVEPRQSSKPSRN